MFMRKTTASLLILSTFGLAACSFSKRPSPVSEEISEKAYVAACLSVNHKDIGPKFEKIKEMDEFAQIAHKNKMSVDELFDRYYKPGLNLALKEYCQNNYAENTPVSSFNTNNQESRQHYTNTTLSPKAYTSRCVQQRAGLMSQQMNMNASKLEEDAARDKTTVDKIISATVNAQKPGMTEQCIRDYNNGVSLDFVPVPVRIGNAVIAQDGQGYILRLAR